MPIPPKRPKRCEICKKVMPKGGKICAKCAGKYYYQKNKKKKAAYQRKYREKKRKEKNEQKSSSKMD